MRMLTDDQNLNQIRLETKRGKWCKTASKILHFKMFNILTFFKDFPKYWKSSVPENCFFCSNILKWKKKSYISVHNFVYHSNSSASTSHCVRPFHATLCILALQNNDNNQNKTIIYMRKWVIKKNIWKGIFLVSLFFISFFFFFWREFMWIKLDLSHYIEYANEPGAGGAMRLTQFSKT